MKQLVLGSNSPRRAQLLTEMGFDFIKRASDVDETIPPHVPGLDAAQYLAELKNEHIDRTENEIVLTADTVVLVGDLNLAKPDSHKEAMEMLRQQSDRVHQVISGVCISTEGLKKSFSSTTEVKFKSFEDWEIEYYVSKFKPMDKAGAYGIQEWIGQIGIEWIKGSFYNVVGLPTEQVFRELVVTFGLHPK